MNSISYYWNNKIAFSFFPLLFLMVNGYSGTDGSKINNATNANYKSTCNRQADSLALVELYLAANGPKWKNKWNLSKPLEEWYGIKLNNQGCVQIVCMNGDLNFTTKANGGNGLNGTLPDLQLPHLKYLLLASNNLMGEIPDFSAMPGLRILQLACNDLSGEIPDFKALPQLKSLELDYNSLEGWVPDFSKIPNLESLYLLGNKLEGTLPDFSELPKLKSIIAFQNKFEGPFPAFTNCPDLQIIKLGDNQLSGSIPSLNHLQELRVFDVRNNAFSGGIPDLSNLRDLSHFVLDNNQFKDMPRLQNLPALDILSVGGNLLTLEDLLDNSYWFASADDYSPQWNSVEDTVIILRPGSYYSLVSFVDEQIDGAIYNWFRNSQAFEKKEGKAATKLSAISALDMGNYYCEISHPALPDLIVNSPVIRLQFSATTKSENDIKKQNKALFYTVTSPLMPNNNSNNVFEIHAVDPVLTDTGQVSLHVFNQIGQVVYSSQSYQNNWKGTYLNTGNTLPSGVYHYQILTQDPRQTKLNGSFSIVN